MLYQMRSFTVTYDDDSTLSTNMNHKITDQEIRDHYIGQTIICENHDGTEYSKTATTVEIHPNTINCPFCGHQQKEKHVHLCQYCGH